jgi:hypothetical protein
MVIIILMLDKKNRNILIIVFSMMVLMLSTFYFFLGIKFQENGKFPEIGEVFKKNNDLRRKIDGTLSWVDIEHSTKIFPGDKVFTGASSLAQLNLLDIAEIGMNSSTLLRIDPKSLEGANNSGMDLQGGLGFFTTKIGGKLTKTSVKLQNATFDLNGAGSEMHVNGLEDKTMVAAIGGSVNYKSVQNGKAVNQTLAPNQMVGMNRAGVATIINLPAKLIAPKAAEEVVLMPKLPVHFKWQVLIQDVPLSLELSKTPAFEKVFLKKEIQKGMSEDDILIDSPMQGVIYWRIVEAGKDEYYHAQQFDYQPMEPPVIYDPVVRQNYPTAMPAGPEFSWEKKFDFMYEGEIQQLDGGIGGSQKFSGPHPSYLGRNLKDGHYQIKVRASKNNLVSDWTAWQPFSIGDVDRNGIELVSPADMATATLLFPQKEVLFEWTGGNAQSQIQIANDENFKDVILEAITDKHTLNWRPRKEGKYFWHVKTGPKAKIGITRSFFVVEPKLALLTPKDKIAYIYRDEGFQDVHFSWEDVSLDDQYVFEFSNTSDFKNVLEHTAVTKPEYELKFPKKNEVIYWHVKTNHQTSPARMFRIYPMPELEAPVLEMVKVKIQEDSTIFGGTTERSPTQLGPDFVEIFLPSIEKAASFRVEIMRDLSAKSMVISKTLSSPLFRWNNPAPGEYFWRVSYKDREGTQSPPSGLARLIVEPKDKAPLKPDTNPFSKIPY